MKFFLMLFLSLMTTYVHAMETTPYAGQQLRSIKALSDNEIDALKNGKGMGLAKAAELNQYPGPRHVLELVSELALSEKQIKQTHKLFSDMKREAMVVGENVILAEVKMDKMFANGNISELELRDVLNEIGKYRSQLRFIHLKTHLKQKMILSERQIKHYDMLRGYGGDMKNHHHHH